MVTMTTPDLWLNQDRPVTVEDLQNVPEDEFRYELDDGMLIVSPLPPPGISCPLPGWPSC
jgi:hypothetical protein